MLTAGLPMGAEFMDRVALETAVGKADSVGPSTMIEDIGVPAVFGVMLEKLVGDGLETYDQGIGDPLRMV